MPSATFDPNAAAPPGSGLFGRDDSVEEARVVVIPVPFDATTSYHRGAAAAPQAVLHASHQVDLYDVETGEPFRAGIAMLPLPQEVLDYNRAARAGADPILAAGGYTPREGDAEENLLAVCCAEVNDLCARVERWVDEQTEALLAAGKVVGVLGGDHAVSLGAIAAHARRFPGLGILHIDAHADLRRAYEGFEQSHASIMYNVMTRLPEVARLVQVAVRDVCAEEVAFIDGSGGRVRCHFDAALWQKRHAGVPWATLCERIIADLPEQVYVSCDIDGLDPALCPHTGTPVPGGLQFAEVTTLLRLLASSGRRIVGFDLTEVAPAPDPDDDWDANVGARMLYKLIGFTLLSQRQG